MISAKRLTRNQLSDEHIQRMQLDEDFTYQNQFSQIKSILVLGKNK